MAAAHQPCLELWDLKRLSALDISPLLREETEHWHKALDWNFERSADLVRKFMDAHALAGAALVDGSGVVGYAYSVVEENKGIIGDLYICKHLRSPEYETRLLNAVLDDLFAVPSVRRIESQLILVGNRERPLPRAEYLQTFDRDFLELDLDAIDPLPAFPQPGLSIEPWGSHFQEAAAHLITSAYAGHIDALINDQYRSVAGARRFLFNIVQYPGCGTFLPQASLVVVDRTTGYLVGVCLASIVNEGVGHITQICSSRNVRGRKLGYEMMRQTLILLRLNGCKRVTLTVTSQNRVALDLYTNLGFRSLRRFRAFVWEGF